MRNEVDQYLRQLRETIIKEFSSLELNTPFTRKPWEHHTGGGGEIGILRGDVFEKAAVNFSAVSGDTFPLEGHSGPFFATGISLITHMMNPHAPTVHMNLRYVETASAAWLGGGYDLTPMGFPYQQDTDHFHETAKKALQPFGENLYQEFSKNADEYFYIPHRKKTRGVGGLFFDHRPLDEFEMWKNIGNTFLDAILPIYNQEQKSTQFIFRGHYAEFNLVYDRGTAFGLRSGGNPEAIFVSLPPRAEW
jgi:coproporphyrinogen III oxidase